MGLRWLMDKVEQTTTADGLQCCNVSQNTGPGPVEIPVPVALRVSGLLSSSSACVSLPVYRVPCEIF